MSSDDTGLKRYPQDKRNATVHDLEWMRKFLATIETHPGRGRSLLGVSLCQRLKQISYGKQGKTKNSTPEIEGMTHAMLEPPLHPRKQVKGFADMRKNDHH